MAPVSDGGKHRLGFIVLLSSHTDPLYTRSIPSKRKYDMLQAIWEELQDVVHAVDAMVTKTPDEMKN
jgi:hypothetical protein